MRLVKALVVVALVISLATNGIMYLKWSGKRPIFSVNGEGVSKRDFTNWLEMRNGQQLKADLVQQMIIEQAARKQGVYPSDKEVEEEYENQRDTSYAIARQVEQKPWLVDEYKRNIRLTFARVRLLTKGIPVTPEQIAAEYNSHPAAFDTPSKAHVQFAAVLDASQSEQIKALMAKKVEPTVIQTSLKGSVVFLGYNYKLEMVQRPGNEPVFSMQKDEVKVVPAPPDLARQGVKAIVLRMLDTEPGKKADLNDPKTKERITWQVAMRQAKPWQEYLATLWADTNFWSDNPDDKRVVEAFFFPDKARSAQR